jgi:uncharacterized membrane protein YbaN (DUF454 family)
LFGSSLLGLGILGLGLPLLQGWFFILLGILVLAKDIAFFGRLADRIKRGAAGFAKAEEA